MPMFQRRHYEEIAETLRVGFMASKSNADQITAILLKFRYTLLADNERFDFERFCKAAVPQIVGPEVSFSLSDIEQAQSMVKGLKRKRA